MDIPQEIMSLVAKTLRYLNQNSGRYAEQIANVAWQMLPNILSSLNRGNGTLILSCAIFFIQLLIEFLQNSIEIPRFCINTANSVAFEESTENFFLAFQN